MYGLRIFSYLSLVNWIRLRSNVHGWCSVCSGPVDYIVATTKLINGSTWIQSLMNTYTPKPPNPFWQLILYLLLFVHVYIFVFYLFYHLLFIFVKLTGIVTFVFIERFRRFDRIKFFVVHASLLFSHTQCAIAVLAQNIGGGQYPSTKYFCLSYPTSL